MLTRHVQGESDIRRIELGEVRQVDREGHSEDCSDEVSTNDDPTVESFRGKEEHMMSTMSRYRFRL